MNTNISTKNVGDNIIDGSLTLEQNADCLIDHNREKAFADQLEKATTLSTVREQEWMQQLIKQLPQKKVDSRKRLINLLEEYENVKQKERFMDQMVSNLDSYYISNEEKRTNAISKLASEKRKLQERESAVIKLKDEISSLKSKRSKLKKFSEKLNFYKTFLSDCVQLSESYTDPDALISRYHELMATQSELERRDTALNASMQKLKADIYKLQEAKNEEKLSLTNEAANLRRSIETEYYRRKNKEVMLRHGQMITHRRMTELGLIKNVINNMYAISRNYEKFGTTLPNQDICGQLRVVSKFICDLKEITRE